MENGLTPYGSFVKGVKDLVYRHQYEALKKVNSELMSLYWEIGEEICRQQQEKGWGKSVMDVLSKELQKEFPGIQGFSARNIWRMRNSYFEHSQDQILPPTVAEIQKPILPPSVGEMKKIASDVADQGMEFERDMVQFFGYKEKWTQRRLKGGNGGGQCT